MAHLPGPAFVLRCRMEPAPLPAGLTLTPTTPADNPAVADLITRAHPDWARTAADLDRFDEMRLAGEVFERVLARRDGEAVGMAEVGQPRMDGHPGWLNLEVVTLERDLFGPLLAWAEATAAQHQAQTLITRLKENWWEKEAWEAAGYAEHDRMWLSVLDLTTLDFGRFAAQQARARAAGITLHPLSELGDFDEAQQRKLYDLIAALLRDVPSATPVAVLPFESWQQRFGHIKHPEGLWLAVAPTGEWVGLNELHLPVSSAPHMLHNGLTGVLPAWRGQGIAYALKLAAARSALERGFTHARTSNHSVNAPMLAINAALGFVRDVATVKLRRTLSN